MYYQPNKHKVGDCAVRALSAALRISWEEAYEILVAKGREIKDMPSDTATMEAVLKDYGFKKDITVAPQKGQKRITAVEYADKCKTAVLFLANHFVATKMGLLWDIWDCSNKCVYKAYYKD